MHRATLLLVAALALAMCVEADLKGGEKEAGEIATGPPRDTGKDQRSYTKKRWKVGKLAIGFRRLFRSDKQPSRDDKSLMDSLKEREEYFRGLDVIMKGVSLMALETLRMEITQHPNANLEVDKEMAFRGLKDKPAQGESVSKESAFLGFTRKTAHIFSGELGVKLQFLVKAFDESRESGLKVIADILGKYTSAMISRFMKQALSHSGGFNLFFDGEVVIYPINQKDEFYFFETLNQAEKDDEGTGFVGLANALHDDPENEVSLETFMAPVCARLVDRPNELRTLRRYFGFFNAFGTEELARHHKMNYDNIGTIFGPWFEMPPTDNPTDMQAVAASMAKAGNAIKYLIEHKNDPTNPTCFSEGSDPWPEADDDRESQGSASEVSDSEASSRESEGSASEVSDSEASNRREVGADDVDDTVEPLTPKADDESKRPEL